MSRGRGQDGGHAAAHLIDELRERGVHVMARRHGTVAEEMPEAYKDVADVVDVVHGAGLAVRVAQLRPLGVIKG